MALWALFSYGEVRVVLAPTKLAYLNLFATYEDNATGYFPDRYSVDYLSLLGFGRRAMEYSVR